MASITNGLIEKIQVTNNGVTTAHSIASTAYGYCTTLADDPAKVVEMEGFVLYTGVTIHVKFANANSAANPTLQFNDEAAINAKPIVQYEGAAVGTSANTTGWHAGAVLTLTYDGDRWIRDQGFNTNDNTIPAAYCSTSAATQDKVASCTGYTLKDNSWLHIILTKSNSYNGTITLNVNSSGAKNIWINGAVSSSSNKTLPSGSYIIYYDGSVYHFRTDGKLPGDIAGNAATATTATNAGSVSLNGITDAPNLQAIEALTGTGFLIKGNNDTWSLDTNSYSTTNHTHSYAGSSSSGGAATNINVSTSTASSAYIISTSGNSDSQSALSQSTLTIQNTVNSSNITATVLHIGANNKQGSLVLYDSVGGYTGTIVPPSNFGANRTYTLPANGGTIALTGSDITGNAATANAISPAGTAAQFWRGDNLWSDTISGGVLKVINNGNTFTMGSSDGSFNYLSNSANVPFLFNKTILTSSGDLGNSTYPFNNLYIGKSGTKGIYYVGTKATKEMITFIDNTTNTNGNGMKIGGGGVVIIGAGDTANTLDMSAATEDLYLLADSNIFIESNTNSAIGNRVGVKIDTSGNVIPTAAENNHNNSQDLGSSSSQWANVYANEFIGDIKANRIKPSLTKTYTNTSFYGTTNTNDTCSFYFMSVKPNSWRTPWTVRFKIHSYCPSYPNGDSITWSTISGRSDSMIYHNWNERSESAHSYITIHMLKEAGFTAGLGHAFGINLINSWNYTNSAYYRTFEVEYYDCENCTVTFLDAPVLWSNWSNGSTTNYYPDYTNFDAINRGLRETGDDNDIGIIQMNNGRYINGNVMPLAQYGLFGFDREWKSQTISLYSSGYRNATTSINTARVYNTHGIDYTKGLLYNSGGNFNVNEIVTASPRISMATIDFRYTDNVVASATANTLGMIGEKPVFLRGTIEDDGLFYLAPMTIQYNSTNYQRVWTQDVPTSADGYVYWFIGYPHFDSAQAASLYRIDLFVENPIYWYHNGRFEEYIGHAETTDLAAKATTIKVNSATTTKSWITGTSTTLGSASSTINADPSIYLTTNAGEMSAKIYSVNDGADSPVEKVKLQWNSTDDSLDFIFI